MTNRQYDAVVVGSGPNGLSSAITLQKEGLSVLLIEGKDTIGGGMRTQELTLPGFKHDVCSAIHPMAMGSPFFATLPLQEYGLEFIQAPLAAAHPFDDGTTAFLSKSIEETATSLGVDKAIYLKLIQPLVTHWEEIAKDTMGPLSVPSHPLLLAKFGLNAIRSADTIAKKFQTQKAKGLWGGMSAHAIQPLDNWASAAIGLMLSAVGHKYGWPIPKGGSQSIANALGAYFTALGGEIQTGQMIEHLGELPPHKIVLFDLTPRQLLKIAGEELSPIYKWQLEKYRHGMGVFKVDWALDGSVPFKSEICSKAATVHLGNTYAEIAHSERTASEGRHSQKPFVLLAQQSMFDATRAPEGKHTVWGYCHVPNGSTVDMTDAIENQVERFAPGFKDRVLARNVMNTAQMEAYNPNYIGGDINGGIIDISQLYTRPALRVSPYKTSHQKIYICSSSTPPGGGVHGMCGYHAAKTALSDHFGIKISL
ncbi:fumarate reductase/succinate dehydrogenase flavoprotein domain protein [Pseudopedobacter saltans DSM 12145]|uniref:Fumarate reductase/succinate dehydrogenase flavoprotein domain protein n=1 Tax=Pseudopedobacter saltans (strain ATCC 51119 / DSM 12145 / JCM 21818 / CCUG 39354 / LMG 10337 / NBRC 100064 / NCIMB 13643) TaxID=762903 RepID=F0S9Z4_PSESL|nr:NAD(P)/FAD-dependent oxidoreductase [Pseudopedobacter saltans]ADY52552.1 fumarate reductase/succinate dehydrogenase flavoprotein domain protein [Pseudopedobacter saltans DSM 12145]